MDKFETIFLGGHIAIAIIAIAIIIGLIIRRQKIKKKEDFEKREN